MISFVYSSLIQAPVERVFAFHEQPDALERLTPPWQPVEVLRREGGIADGAVVELRLRFGPLARRWVALHMAYERNHFFEDVQKEGPFRYWRHRHEMTPEGGATRLTDRIEFSLPGGPLVDWAIGWLARRQLTRLFRYRHEVTRRACEAPASGAE
jgi:ligand-binding SRPBCC domain-containing protein